MSTSATSSQKNNSHPTQNIMNQMNIGLTLTLNPSVDQRAPVDTCLKHVISGKNSHAARLLSIFLIIRQPSFF